MKEILRAFRVRRLCALLLALLALSGCVTEVGTGEGTESTASPITTEAPIDPVTVAPETTVAPAPDTTIAPQTTAPAPETTEPKPVIASGKISSNTGSNLEIHVEWSVIGQTDRAVTLRAEAYITCYTIWVSARSGGKLKIGNSSQSFSTDAIIYEGKGKQTYPLATSTVDIPLGTNGTAEVEISASWPFMGSYSGIRIEYLTCSDTVVVGREKAPETTAPETTAPVTTAPVTTAAPETTTPSVEIRDEGDAILYQTRVFLDRDLRHWSSVALVTSAESLARLIETHPTDCNQPTCLSILDALGKYDAAFFAENTLLLVPQGNLYPTAAPVEIFDMRADAIALHVHIRDIAASRKTEVLSSTRFYLQIAEIPSASVGTRMINVIQHGTFYTDSGKYESDYLREEGKVSEPTVRTYQPAAITP